MGFGTKPARENSCPRLRSCYVPSLCRRVVPCATSPWTVSRAAAAPDQRGQTILASHPCPEPYDSPPPASDLSDHTSGPQHSSVGICPKRAEASAQSRPLASARHAPPKAKRGHPLRICPIARRRVGQPPPNPPSRTPRPRRTAICPITLPPAPFAPSRICPIALPTRDARSLRTVRARCNGGARPAHEEPATPPNARATCRPDLRAPPPPCPLRP
jgi:hypothetical protein